MFTDELIRFFQDVYPLGTEFQTAILAHIKDPSWHKAITTNKPFYKNFHHPIEPYKLDLPKGFKIVFIDGKVSDEHTWLPPHISCYTDSSTSLQATTLFGMLATLERRKVVIEIAAEFKCVEPIHIICLSNQVYTPLEIMVTAKTDSHCTMTYQADGGSWHNVLMNYHVEKKAHLELVCYQCFVPTHTMTIQASLEQEAIYHAFACIYNNQKHHLCHSVEIAQGCEATFKSLQILQQQQHADVISVMKHLDEASTSLQEIYSIVSHSSRMTFQGRISIDPLGQQTKAYQKHHNLLIGDRAYSQSNPYLDIRADDVKASHGATFGKLNEEHLLFLYMRGISPEQAALLLIKSFCTPLLQDLPETIKTDVVKSTQDLWHSLT